MPLGEFNGPSLNVVFPSISLLKTLNFNLLAVNLLWFDVPLFSMPAKFFSKNLVAVVKLGSSGVVVSCGCVACLKLEPENQEEMKIASLNRVEKKIRDVFFDGAGFKMYASKRVEVAPGGFTVCEVFHCPGLQEEL